MLKPFPQCALHLTKERATGLFNFRQARLLKRPTVCIRQGSPERKECMRKSIGWILRRASKRHKYQINSNGKRGNHTLKSSLNVAPVLTSANIPEVGEEGEDLSKRLETWDDGQNSNNNRAPNIGSNRRKPELFEEYLPISEVKKGLEDGTFIKGHVRIRATNRMMAFVAPEDGSGNILIINEGWERIKAAHSTNKIRALPGDLVAVQLWNENYDDKTEILNLETSAYNDENMVSVKENEPLKEQARKGKVVAVLEKLHRRTCTGVFTQDAIPHDQAAYAKFMTSDWDLPNLFIPIAELPTGFFDDIKAFSGKLFQAKIGDWEYGRHFPIGKLEKIVGDKGDIETEVERLLVVHNVDTSDLNKQVLWPFEKGTMKAIPQKEIAYRRDFRDACIFTIDPPTAMDIDDALSCEKLGNGLYRVGVHIADVSHFVQESSSIDMEARKRTTSFYLMDKVIPMLPKILSEDLCSLNPDVERLAFSVEWIMTEDGQVKNQWFGRSIIKSCAKLTYDHAQLFIDNPNEEVDVQELPPISKPFKPKDIALRIRNLHKIAVQLRKKRFESGALQLDKMKLKFTLDEASKNPVKCSVYKRTASNELIEEFMLLANMTVARIIKEVFASKAVLRCHEPIKPKDQDSLRDTFLNLGLSVDVTSAGTIQKSLDKYGRSNEFEEAKMQVMLSFVAKRLMLAKYFCAETKEESEYFHYALNVPLYTHFTSPIRRYPDILVHRLLGAVLKYCDCPRSTNLPNVLDHANKKRLDSKKLEDALADLYFAFYLKSVGPIREKVMVVSVLKYSVKVFVIKYGLTCKIPLRTLPLKGSLLEPTISPPIIIWMGDDSRETFLQEIRTFAILECELEYFEKDLRTRWKATVVRPSVDCMEGTSW